MWGQRAARGYNLCNPGLLRPLASPLVKPEDEKLLQFARRMARRRAFRKLASQIRNPRANLCRRQVKKSRVQVEVLPHGQLRVAREGLRQASVCSHDGNRGQVFWHEVGGRSGSASRFDT
jgi:hypothetical protein